MKIEHLAIADIIVLTPEKFSDERGFFSETYNAARVRDAGITDPFVQDNQSVSYRKGVVRGLHCQLAPHAQGKLVRCARGAIWDVVVDIRTGSTTYGQWAGVELSEENWSQIWIPPGFLHGFCSLTDYVEVHYKCTEPYDKTLERSVIWNSRELAINWPVTPDQALLSDKDREAPEFSVARGWF
jgi:dTDP-4-dehydrorhamnose 3,5-epimerase